jgi:hypothetical protein
MCQWTEFHLPFPHLPLVPHLTLLPPPLPPLLPPNLPSVWCDQQVRPGKVTKAEIASALQKIHATI